MDTITKGNIFAVLRKTILAALPTVLCACSTQEHAQRAADEAFLKKYPTIERDGKLYKDVPPEDLLMREEVPPPPAPASSGTSIKVNLSKKRAWLYRDGLLSLTSPICAGRKGSETPTGRFKVIAKHRDWVSTLYNVPMPHFLRLNADSGQVGLHAGNIHLEPASRGCIRLPSKMASAFFEKTPVGSTVLVSGDPAPASDHTL